MSLLAALLIAAPPSGTAALQQGLDRLRIGGDTAVLYVAAHPDDENTRLLAWLVGEKHVRAVYVSLTRGDGGQNLVGKELGPLLGAIRTHELLAARRVDGAEQRFSRAIDFGYSKSAAETFRVWDREAVLGDLVRVIREVRPRAIVTRFSTEPPNHGHHTASAILAREAFDAAADPKRFPEQGLPPHQALRLVENKSPWRFQPGQDLSMYAAVDVGGYSPVLGRSWGEVAAESRTMHKSQGFGSAPLRGRALEYFQHLAGTPAPAVDGKPGDPFGDVTGGARSPLQTALDEAQAAFDPAHPEALLAPLAKAAAVAGEQTADVERLMVQALGLVIEARVAAPSVRPGDALDVAVTALARTTDARLERVAPIGGAGAALEPAATLARNVPWSGTLRLTVPADAAPSTPFWLVRPPTTGSFAVDAAEATRPVAPPALRVRAELQVAGRPLVLEVPVEFAWVDPVHGERAHAVDVLPPVTVTPRLHAVLVGRPYTPERAGAKADRAGLTQPGVVTLDLLAHAGPARGQVSLALPKGWTATPASAPFDLAAGAGATVAFRVTGPSTGDPSDNAPANAHVRVSLGDAAPTPAFAREAIDHPHIPRLTILRPATVKLVPIALEGGGVKRVGVIPGAGDEVPEALAQAGYTVVTLDPGAPLDGLDAVVIGIRALNVTPELARQNDALMRFAERGGVVLMQYVTSNRMKSLGTIPLGPWPFTVAQGRVTDENAAMEPLDPAHPALTTPNRLGPADQAGWVQERGLYFADTWDARYTPLFRIKDSSGAKETGADGDGPFDGAVLIGRVGKGAFVYTGLGFFRQLPAGVPGAFRLFANLLALGEPPATPRP